MNPELTPAAETSPPVYLSYKSGRSYQTSHVEHLHEDDYEFYFLVSGSKSFSINGRAYVLSPGDALYIPAGVAHRSIEGRKGELSNRIVLIVGGELFRESMQFLHSRNVYPPLGDRELLISLASSGRSAAEVLLKSLNGELAACETGYSCMCRSYLDQLLVCLTRSQAVKAPVRESRACANMDTVREYIALHYDQDLTLGSLAETFFMNPSALSRSFKKATGDALTAYIARVRVEKAKELLEEKKIRIETVARKLGFHTQTSFERAFKRVAGMTPFQYRSRMHAP